MSNETSERFNGVVKFFSNERGFGFILKNGRAEDGEFFVHFTSILMDGYKTLKQDQKVSFELKDTEKGAQAVNVMVEEE